MPSTMQYQHQQVARAVAYKLLRHAVALRHSRDRRIGPPVAGYARRNGRSARHPDVRIRRCRRSRTTSGCRHFPFPVRYGVVPRTAVIRVAHSGDDALLATFIHAAAGLVDQGCLGIATTCSFLARWQAELAMSLSVPVLSSSLLQVPLVQRLLPHRQRVGIVIRSAIEVDADNAAAGGHRSLRADRSVSIPTAISAPRNAAMTADCGVRRA